MSTISFISSAFRSNNLKCQRRVAARPRVKPVFCKHDDEQGALKGDLGDLERAKSGDIVPRLPDMDLEKTTLEKNPLYDMVNKLQGMELVARFNRSSPPEVQAAFRATLVNMVGSLPSALYTVTVQTMVENLVQLMQTCIMTGYMFRNAQYRLSILKSLESGDSGRFDQERSVKEVDIVRANDEALAHGKDEASVQQYVDSLRSEVSSLRKEIDQYRGNPDAKRETTNELIGYIAALNSEELKSLTNDAGPAVIDAMRKVIANLLEGKFADTTEKAEISMKELAPLLFYNMVAGYFLREAELKFNLQRKLDEASTQQNMS